MEPGKMQKLFVEIERYLDLSEEMTAYEVAGVGKLKRQCETFRDNVLSPCIQALSDATAKAYAIKVCCLLSDATELFRDKVSEMVQFQIRAMYVAHVARVCDMPREDADEIIRQASDADDELLPSCD